MQYTGSNFKFNLHQIQGVENVLPARMRIFF